MAGRREKRQPKPAAAGGRISPGTSERLRRLALAGLSLLLVATPLLPSEGAAETGTGSVLIMAVLGLMAIVLTGDWLSGSARQWDGADAAVLALLIWLAISGWVMGGEGNARGTINASWQWVSFGALYLLVRQLAGGAAERRALCVLLLGLATALSSLGYYQFFYSMPQLRAEYQTDPERVLREEGIDAAPGSPERKLFEDRLYSTEPIATFALANSLAGLLVPWLIIGLGIGLSCWRNLPLRHHCGTGVAISGLLIGFCLLLTKSRTAVLATGVGLAAIAVVQVRGGQRIGWRIPLAGAALLGILIGAGIATGAFDLLMVSETPKSLLYRLEYWQATITLIADHPWFGCGPGNFQQYYASYKLPQASEIVADPHNFLLEVWATAGTPALLALIALLILLVRRGLAGADRNHAPAGEPRDAAKASISRIESFDAGGREDDPTVCGWIWAGGLAGVIAAFPLGFVAGLVPPMAVLWLGLPAAAAVVYLLRGWAISGELPTWLLLSALAALLLNLSAAGGIGFAGVSATFWTLSALLVNQSGRGAGETRLFGWPDRANSALQLGLAAVGWVLVVACNRTMYIPVLAAQTRISEGFAWAEQGRLDRAAASFGAAAEADRRAARPWLQLAAVHHRRLLETQSAQVLAEFEEALRQAQLRDRRSYPQRRLAGNWRLALFRRWGDANQLQAAIDEYLQWSKMYPSHSAAYAQLAWSYAIAGQPERAAEYAAEALQLDSINPHRERKLFRLQVFEPDPGKLPEDNAEQLMRRLRSGPADGVVE